MTKTKGFNPLTRELTKTKNKIRKRERGKGDARGKRGKQNRMCVNGEKKPAQDPKKKKTNRKGAKENRKTPRGGKSNKLGGNRGYKVGLPRN